jgi:hypothetical protein
VHSTRPVPRRSTFHLRAIFAVVLALGLVLAIAAPSWAALTVTIDSGPGPSTPTNDPTPLFGFTPDAGATTVDCAIDSVDQVTPVFGLCSGPTTDSPLLPLIDGDYVFRVRVSDGVDEQIAEQPFSVDTVAPSLTIDSGPSTPTRDTAPSFGFTVTDASATSVECSIDQGTPDFGPCSGPATHAPDTPLDDGAYFFRVRATDAAGNPTERSQAFSVDTAAPSLSITAGPSTPTRDTTPSFGFTVTDESATTVECSIDHGTPTYGDCTTATSHTAASLADGDYVFHVRATDAVGNQTERSRAFSVDTVAPTVLMVSGPAGATNNRTPSFGFTVDDESATDIKCSIDHGTPTYRDCTTATSQTAASLSDGDYVFHVKATDAAGNQTERTQSFSIDGSAPSLSIDSGPRGPTNDTTPSFGFTTDASTVECSIDHGTPTYGDCTTATSHSAASLGEGSYLFHVRATDGAGNQAEAFQAFTVDTTPPSLSIGFGPSGTTSDSTPLFGFTAEAGATVECSIDQGVAAYGPCASATTHAAVAPLADGAYVFRVRATDRAGNQRTDTRAFTVDTAPQTPAPETPRPDPTPPVTSPVTPPSTALQLLSPFPLVRISGTLTSTGARIRLLSVRAPRGALVRVTVSPACSAKRHASRRCRVLRAAGTVGRHDLISFRSLARAYRSGTVIVVRVWRADRIGKYTRFTIERGRAPRRVDQCLVPAATHGSRCPTG